MKALTLDRPGQFRYTETDIPERKPGETLLKVKCVGVCGTDLHAYEGTQPFFSYPRVLGHELCAEVVEVDSEDQGLRAGDLVTIEPLLNCGVCYSCRIGKRNCCEDLKVLGVHTGGGMQEYISVPTRLLHKSDKLSAEELAICEMLSIGTHGVNRAAVDPGEWVCVIGAGPIGLGTLQVASARGAKLVVIDLSHERLQVARELGADYTINPEKEDSVTQLRKVTGGDMAAAVLDCVGQPPTIEQSVELVAHGGRIVLIGLSDRPVSLKPSTFVRKEIDFRGSRNSLGVFPTVLELVESKQVDLKAMITHRVEFESVRDIFENFKRPDFGLIKGIIHLS